MAFKLQNVVPWGRSLPEYIKMFDLRPEELQLKLLDCAGGPASFNAEMFAQGYYVISCDPLYQCTAAEIAQRIKETAQTVIDGARLTKDNFVWREFQSPEHLGQIRAAAMSKFLADLPTGIRQGRYLTDALPALSFKTGQFDLALCSNLLFTYSEQLGADFHLAAILEMCRVATEVRIFPLLVNFSTEVSPLLQPVMNQLQELKYEVEIRQVPYEFQIGGNQLLRIKSKLNQPTYN